MRHDTYTVEIDRKEVYVFHQSAGYEQGITLGEYDALIVALIRGRERYKLERMNLDNTDAPDEEQPEWGKQYGTPAHTPAPDTVTYTVKWQVNEEDGERADEGEVDFDEARRIVAYSNERWVGLNHWAVGTDGSIIGYVGAPK